MRQVTLGKSGLTVSAVGFGGIPIQRVSEADALRAIREALDLGVTFFDTAAGYSDSQKKIGAAIRGRRDGLVLASKSGQRTAAAILSDIERSVREMDAGYLDLYQLHGVSSEEVRQAVHAPGGALEGLRTARAHGFIRHIGVSSHSLDVSLRLLDDPVYETLQFPFNLVTAEPAQGLIPKCRDLNVGFIAMKPLCGGQYEDAELAFRFLNAFPDIVPIPGIERPEEIRQIVRLVASGETLQGEQRARAEKIAQDLGKLFCRRCGYCEPCPQGVPLTTAMVYEGLAKRLPPERFRTGIAKTIVEKAGQCTECAECEGKCPYHLPIIQTVKAALASARRLLGTS